MSFPVGRRSPAWGLAGGFLVSVLVWGWLWFFVPTGGKVLMGVTATVMMLAIMLAAVSYTHLDVYKRQSIERHPGAVMEIEARYGKDGNSKRLIMAEDVYKRQL